MKLFGFNKKKDEETFQIAEENRLWVEENFNWLISALGDPDRNNGQILFTEKFFPKTFKAGKVSAKDIVDDLCQLLMIQDEKVFLEIRTDLRDTHGIPYEIEGNPFETDLEVRERKYIIHIANSLQKHPGRLINCLVCEFVRIKLTDSNLEFDSGDDTDLFIYLAGIYFGFGVLLSQNLHDTGRTNDGFWETKWTYTSELPDEIMAYGLAFYSKLIEPNTPEWREYLPAELRREVEKAIEFLDKN